MIKNYFLFSIFTLFSFLTYAQGPWNFNGSNDIWVSTGTAANLSSGASFSTLDVNGAGNPMLRTSSANINASAVTHAVITLKNNTANKHMRVFYQTSGTNRYVNVAITANDADFVSYYVDMTGNDDWTGTVNDLTFQFRENSSYNSALDGTIDIDNIEMTSSDIGVNMVNNSSFENWNDDTEATPVDPVGFYKHESVERSSDSHSGDYSIKVIATSTRDLAQTVNEITAGATYRVSINYKLEANTGNGVRLWSTWKDASNGNLDSGDIQTSGYFNTVSSEWATFSVDAVAPENATKMNFEVRAYNGATVYWDSFSVSKVQEPAAQPLLITTSVCSTATSVRLTGPWWGWDPAGGPAAADNGDGTWTFTFDPAPTENMEYLLVVDGVQENLISIMANGGDCAPVTDNATYANRRWDLGTGDVTNTYGQCGSSCVAPVITLTGTDVTINNGDTYTDAGATASDDEEGDITANIVVGGDTVDTDTDGTYTITYDVSDGAGNAATTVLRVVTVETPVPTDTETEGFCESGVDSDPTVLTLTPADITVAGSSTISAISVSSMTIAYNSSSGSTTYCPSWYNATIVVTGGVSDGVEITGCNDEIAGLDLTGFTSLTLTSATTDSWSDNIVMCLDLSVTWELPLVTNDEEFCESGVDSDPTIISLTPSDITVNAGEEITAISISSMTIAYNSSSGSTTYCPSWYNATIVVTGGVSDGVEITGCNDEIAGLDLTGFTSLTLTSATTDSWSDNIVMCLGLSVTSVEPSCTAPSEATFTNVTTSSVDASWTAGASETDYEYVVQPLGTGEPTASGTSVIASTSVTIPGLDSGTDYEIYVRSDCGDGLFSAWIQSTFTTLPGCGDTVTDSGGSTGNYAANELTTVTVYPDNAGDLVTFTFLSFNTESCCDDLTVYDGPDTSSTVFGTYAGSTIPDPITSSHSTGALTFVFDSDSSVQYGGYEIAISCSPAPSCVAPSALSVASITTNSAEISWTSDDSSFNIEVVDVTAGGTATGTATNSGVTSPYSLSGLDSNTEYEVYVQTDCGAGETSDWVSLSFTTMPGCGDTVTDSGGSTGNYAANELTTVTVYPDNAGDLVTFTFLSFNTESCCDDLTVYDGPDTSSTVFGTYAGSTIPDPITSSHSTGALTFVFDSDSSVQYGGYEIAISCSPAPSCVAPSALSVASITTNSAEISWTSDDSSFNIEVVDVTAGGTATGTATNSGVTSPYSLSGLDSNTEYEVYVQTDCGSGDTSAWSGPVSFTTEPAPIVPDYTNDFSTYPGEFWTQGTGALENGPSGTSSAWSADGFANDGSTGAARVNVYYSSFSGGNDDWLISPMFDLSSGTHYLNLNVALTAYASTASTTFADGDFVTLMVTEDNGSNWTELYRWDVNNSPSATGDEMPEIDLSSYTSMTKFAFYANSDTSNIDNDFFIDDFQITTTSLGIDEASRSQFTYFPNPVNDVLTIKAQKAVEDITVYNMLGQVVKRQAPNTMNCTVDLSTMQSGAYFVQVSIDNTVETVRVLKK